MCGRYTLRAPIKQIEEELDEELPFPIEERYNISPGQLALVMRGDGFAKQRWGFTSPSTKIVINARVETVSEMPMFKESFRERRCLVLADGFYEWASRPTGKVPVHFHLPGDGILTFAGLWNREGEIVILTTSPNSLVSTVHGRMPVIVPPESRREWVDHGLQREKLLQPFPDGFLKATERSTRLNSSLAEGPESWESPAQGSLF